mgnify:CR=1 FL=1
MADKVPVKATFSGTDVTGLAEFTTSDTVGVAQGGTGATTAAAARSNLGVSGIFNYDAQGTMKTIAVTVASKTSGHPNSGGSSNAYFLDGIEAPFLNLTQGTYRFTQSDSSNSGHPFRFYLDDAKGTAFTTGVTTNGTAGTSGAYTQIVVDDTTPFTLSYQCSSHAFMGSYVHVGGTTTILGQTIDSDSNTITNIANADIKSNAAIALSKLAGGTANRALETSGTGALQVSAVTTTELAVLDGGTSATSTTLADADRVVVNDDGTMVQVALTDFETYFESALDTLSNVTTVGALNAGSITSGFGSIDNGSSTITTTGNITGGTLTSTGNIVVSDGGNIGSASDTDAIAIASSGNVTLSQNLTVTGNLTVSGTTTTVNSTTVSVADPIFEIGDDSSDDNLDRGIKMKYNSSGAKIAFMGFDDSDGKFTMIPDATDSTSVFSGTVGTLKANLEGTIQTAAQGNITSLGTLTGLTIANGGNIGSAGDTDAIAIDSSGNVTISQNLTVQGTTTTQDSQTLTVSANLIEVNTGLTGANSNDSGLVIERGSTGDNAIMMWDESADKFQIGTTTATASSTGNLTVTTGTLVANIEGNLTGTVQTAAQTNITSLGTLTALTVDNVAIDGANIGHTSDTDLMTLASGVLTVNGEISVTTLDIGGTNVGSTAAELNLLDGSAKSTSSITIDDADAFIVIDGTTTKQIPASNIKTYAGGGVTVQEEGSSLSTAGTTLNFVGDTVTATGSGATKTITVADESLINAIIFG